MTSRRPEDPIRFFKDLYAVVVGVALTLAVEQIVDLDRSGVPIRWEHAPLFVAWISVAFPFAHIFVVYLDDAYERRREGVSLRGLWTGNIIVGAAHYLWIIALALFFTRPFVFGYGLVLFMGGVMARDLLLRVHPRGWLSDLERRVGPVFALATAGWLVAMLACQLLAHGSAQTWAIRGSVLAISLGFAFGVYLRAYDHFFAPPVERTSVE